MNLPSHFSKCITIPTYFQPTKTVPSPPTDDNFTQKPSQIPAQRSQNVNVVQPHITTSPVLGLLIPIFRSFHTMIDMTDP